MKYQAINNYLIAKRKDDRATTATGIILHADDKLSFTVVVPPANYSDLLGKTVIINNEVVVYKLPDKIHYAIDVSNVVAVESN